jgi:cell fate (sporulation/competence/biofilm development) regulator YmcA (YheA/YmcA/DUF963 family)
MTDKKLLEDAEKLAGEFKELEKVLKFEEAKKAYQNDPYLLQLKESINKEKKDLHSLSMEKRPEAIKKINQMEKEMDEDAVSVNYFSQKEEIDNLLKPIKDLFRI